MSRKIIAVALAAGSIGLGAVLFVGLRMAFVTDHFYARLVKDPERRIPQGRNIVAPADGIILYVRRFTGSQVPLVIKGRTPIPIKEMVRLQAGEGPASGILIGIYMNTFGVHVGRVPLEGTVLLRRWYNGPHMDMTHLERKLILAALIPAPQVIKKWLGLAPYQIYSQADYITQSARETLVIDGDFRCHIVRIADYYVGKILTWVRVGQRVSKGQRFGLITWGSQTDLFIETDTPSSLDIRVRVGQYVYGGETIIASY